MTKITNVILLGKINNEHKYPISPAVDKDLRLVIEFAVEQPWKRVVAL